MTNEPALPKRGDGGASIPGGRGCRGHVIYLKDVNKCCCSWRTELKGESGGKKKAPDLAGSAACVKVQGLIPAGVLSAWAGVCVT